MMTEPELTAAEVAELPDVFSENTLYTEPPSQGDGWWRWVLLVCVALLAVGVSGYWYVHSLNEPPAAFPIDQPITIESGQAVRTITDQLETAQVVRSADLLYAYIVLEHDPRDIKASTYVFDTPLTARDIATRLTEGDFDTDLVTFTHFEGERVEKLGERLAEQLPNFDADTFIQLALPYEGTLFPDTYRVPPDFTAEDVFNELRATYDARLEPLRPEIANQNLSEADVIILASIVEREANTPESMKYVAGIFRNRLEIGMPLQADASIEYVLDTPLNELPPGALAENLREVDSPYNTYKNPGLPPGPIGNPGLTAIESVVQPTPSDYFYYLTAPDGTFYYAETFAEHQRNINTYLR